MWRAGPAKRPARPRTRARWGALADKGARPGRAGQLPAAGPLDQGKHHHLDLGELLADAGGGLQPAEFGHAPVHQHHIRPDSRRQGHALQAIAGLANQIHAGVLQ